MSDRNAQRVQLLLCRRSLCPPNYRFKCAHLISKQKPHPTIPKLFVLQLQQIADQQQQLTGTRLLLERLFPALSAPPAIAYVDWLGQLGQHIEQQRLDAAAAAEAATAVAVAAATASATAAAAAATSAAAVVVVNNVGGGKANNHHANHQPLQSANNHSNNADEAHAASESSSSADADALILENAKLQATVEEYKTIVTETVSDGSVHNSWAA